MAAHATEAVGVEEFIHGPHRRLSTGQSLTALPTNLCGRGGDDRCMFVHIFNEVLGHSLQLLHFPHVQRDASTWDSNWARG